VSTMQFTKATKKQAKLRLALEGPAGFGKTFTGLTLAGYLGKRTAFADTEAGSASKYAHLFDFDVIEIAPPFHPHRAVEAIEAAVEGGYDTVIVDSLSHFWQGDGGLLNIVDEVARTKYRGDSHRAWKEGGEIEQDLINAILRSPIHVIGAMRTKKDYVRSTDDSGKTKIRAAGTKTIQREEFDFEFDLVGRFDVPAVLTIMKTRVDTLPPETVIDKPGADLAATLLAWLELGEENVAIERPSAADQKKLGKLIADLNKADTGRDWAEIADKYARREFGHGVGALTKTEHDQTIQAMSGHLESLTNQAEGPEGVAA
jgi:hypothetical protein